MINVGIDVGKRFCQAALKAEDGRLLDELRFENSSHGVQELIRHITVHGEARAVLESTGNYWIRIHDTLEDNSIDTILANPRKTKIITGAKIKSDKLDARTLATLLQGNIVFESYVPPKSKRENRILVRHRAGLVKTRTEIRNRIHAILAKHELANHEYSDLFGKEGSTWLETLQLPGADQTVLKTNLPLLKALDEQIELVTREIAKTACNQENIQILMTLPGVDFYSAMVIASEIGDVKRFPTQWKLVAYAGLAPSKYQSGEYERRGGITKQGSSWLRWILVQAAQHARQHDPRFKAYYERVAKRRGSQKAVVAVAKEMLVVIWFMLTRREPYRDQNPKLVERKLRTYPKIVQS